MAAPSFIFGYMKLYRESNRLVYVKRLLDRGRQNVHTT